MSKVAAFTKAELARFAEVATAKNATFEIRRGGTVIRVSPQRDLPPIDDSEESRLARELEEFDKKHGYN